MACITNGTPISSGAETAPFMGRLLKRYRMWRRYRDTLVSLASLDARMLADIDVAPGEIAAAARRAAREAVAA